MRRHAEAEVEHDNDREGLRLVLEERDRLRLPVVEDGELVLLEIRDEPALSVGDGSQYRHDARAGLESGLLPEERSGGKYQRG
jgi:hypothetical protein